MIVVVAYRNKKRSLAPYKIKVASQWKATEIKQELKDKGWSMIRVYPLKAKAPKQPLALR
jgi:hypothetical protein